MSNDGIGCQSIEAVEERVEVARAHSFSHRSRAADIGEQQRDWDLYPRHPLLAKHSYASRAEGRIAGGLRVPRMSENEATQPRERSLANLAAWIGRNSPECPPLLGQARTLPGQHGPDLFRSPSLGRHLIKLRRKSPSRLRCDRCLCAGATSGSRGAAAFINGTGSGQPWASPPWNPVGGGGGAACGSQ